MRDALGDLYDLMDEVCHMYKYSISPCHSAESHGPVHKILKLAQGGRGKLRMTMLLKKF